MRAAFLLESLTNDRLFLAARRLRLLPAEEIVAGAQAGAPETGILYHSVRRAGGTNLCIYRPSQVHLPVRQSGHFEYHWDGQGRATVVKLTEVAL